MESCDGLHSLVVTLCAIEYGALSVVIRRLFALERVSMEDACTLTIGLYMYVCTCEWLSIKDRKILYSSTFI